MFSGREHAFPEFPYANQRRLPEDLFEHHDRKTGLPLKKISVFSYYTCAYEVLMLLPDRGWQRTSQNPQKQVLTHSRETSPRCTQREGVSAAAKTKGHSEESEPPASLNFPSLHSAHPSPIRPLHDVALSIKPSVKSLSVTRFSGSSFPEEGSQAR